MATETIDFELEPYKLFDLYLSGRGITSRWVASNLNVSDSYICKIRSGASVLTENIRQKLNELLETDY